MEESSTGRWYSSEYWSFTIGDEANDDYRIAVDGYSGDAGDGLRSTVWYPPLTFHDGMSFTTFDQDNDHNGSNCASLHSGGWWFNSCHLVCLTCISNHEWFSLSGVLHTFDQLSVSRMMIKLQ